MSEDISIQYKIKAISAEFDIQTINPLGQELIGLSLILSDEPEVTDKLILEQVVQGLNNLIQINEYDSSSVASTYEDLMTIASIVNNTHAVGTFSINVPYLDSWQVLDSIQKSSLSLQSLSLEFDESNPENTILKISIQPSLQYEEAPPTVVAEDRSNNTPTEVFPPIHEQNIEVAQDEITLPDDKLQTLTANIEDVVNELQGLAPILALAINEITRDLINANELDCLQIILTKSRETRFNLQQLQLNGKRLDLNYPDPAIIVELTKSNLSGLLKLFSVDNARLQKEFDDIENLGVGDSLDRIAINLGLKQATFSFSLFRGRNSLMLHVTKKGSNFSITGNLWINH